MAKNATPRKVLKDALKAAKAAGLIAYGITVDEAIAQGLMTAKGKVKGAKAPKAAATKVEAPEDGLSFMDLRAALKDLKAQGLIKPGVTVMEARRGGLMDAYGAFTGTAPAEEAVEAPKAVAAQAPDAPAKVRRANGTIAPKSEWALRTALAAAGSTPDEVDATMVLLAQFRGANA